MLNFSFIPRTASEKKIFEYFFSKIYPLCCYSNQTNEVIFTRVALKTHFALHNTIILIKITGNVRVALQVGAMKGNLKSIPVKYVTEIVFLSMIIILVIENKEQADLSFWV